MNTKMKAKNTFSFFLLVASILLLATTVSAVGYTIDGVEVNNIAPTNSDNTPASVTAGETAKIEVWFSADFEYDELSDNPEDFYDSDVTVEAEIDTGKEKVRAVSESMIIESGNSKKVTLTLQVPYELKDVRSELVDLTIEINGEKYEVTEVADKDYKLRVKRVQYDTEVMSIETPQSIEAGERIPVDVVIKNSGYNKLDELYITVKIPALEVYDKLYAGDLEVLEDKSEDLDDTLRARAYIEIPYTAKPGIYTLEVEVSNDEFEKSEAKQVVIKNDFANNVVVGDSRKTVSVGQEAEYTLTIANPTNKLKVYRIVADSDSLSTRVSDSVIVIPAGLSKTVKVLASSSSLGEYQFNVNVLSGENVVGTATLNTSVQSNTAANAVVVLTTVLAIIFIVLLAVLVVLVRKKPEKEDFGESYY